MDKKNITIRYVDNWNIDDIIALYKEANWWTEGSDPNVIFDLIQQSYVFTVAVDIKTGHAIGMGRVLSDGISDAYIQDVVVYKKWRGNGVGKLIIEHLVSYCLSHNVTWIALISEPGQDGFYKTLGFNEMKQYTPMKYNLKI